MLSKYLMVSYLTFLNVLCFVVVICTSCSKLEYEVISQDSEILSELQQNLPYIIGSGDVLDITVWRHPDISKETVVRPDGKISLPLIGDIQAAGLTVDEVREEANRRMGTYIAEPFVSVSIASINSLKIYIIGEVARSGEYDLISNTDVLQALAMAGGFTIYAKKDNIKIFRKEDNRKIKIKFDYDQVVKGKNLAQNITLKAGDVILVP